MLAVHRASKWARIKVGYTGRKYSGRLVSVERTKWAVITGGNTRGNALGNQGPRRFGVAREARLAQGHRMPTKASLKLRGRVWKDEYASCGTS